MDEIEEDNRGILENSKIIGRVVIEEGAIIKNSIIKGPCIIGKNCEIRDSYVGPYTSIGDGCRIIGTEIEDSVIMESSKIVSAGRVIESLIGKGVTVRKGDSKPTGQRFVVGDNSEIVL